MEALLRRLHAGGRHPKLIYTVPDFQNPTGVCLSLERRKRLIELADQYDLLIVEDCPYRHVRFEGEHIPSIVSMDSNQRTISLQTFSKVMVPGLRLGWCSRRR